MGEARNDQLASAEGLEPRLQAIFEFVLSMAEGSVPKRIATKGERDAIDAVCVALNMLAETVEAEKRKRLAAEDLLRDEREAYDEAADLLCSVTPAGDLLKLNATFTELMAKERGALLGQRLEELFAERSRADLQRALRAIAAGEMPAPVDLELATSRRPSLVRVQGRVTRDEHGAPTRLRLAFHDVTAERELESRLLVAQKLEALGRLAGGVAHDFNNLLLVMTSAVSLLVPELRGRGEQDVRAFFEAADSAASITQQMLTFARRDVVQHADVEVKATIERALPILTRLAGKDVALTVRLDDVAGLRVPLDEARLQQVVVNLVINARDAMPKGGAVEIAASRVHAEGGRELVRLTVDDAGPGVPLELRAAIFEPFFTTKAPGKGTGLGLATVYGIVSKGGGSVEVESTQRGGARFVVELPAVEKQRTAAVAQPEAIERGTAATVLVLEDDDRVRPLTARILRGAGFRVLEAADRAAALGHAGRGGIELVVADVMLVDDTGPDVVDAMRRLGGDFRVVFVSGYAHDALERPLEKKGFLQKPFTPTDLVAAAREALARR